MPKVSQQYCFMVKGQEGVALQQAEYIKGQGQLGNRHQGGARQVSIMLGEAKEWMGKQTEIGLCFRRYKANIIATDLPPSALSLGNALTIGTAGFVITEYSKECFENCPLYSEGKACPLPFSTAFAEVVESGTVTIGDSIEVYAE